jgi:tetratricopeptide (TPR) repeat protein
MEAARGRTLWSHGSVRGLLRGLRRPVQLERDEIARELRRALRALTAREAVLTLVERALRHEHAFCTEIVQRCDVDGGTTLAVASELHLSVRQFFRYRAHAIEAIAVELESLLTRSSAPSEAAARTVALGRLLLARGAPSDVTSAIRHFERACSIDPLCVEAYAGLAVGWLHLSRELIATPMHAHAKARALAQRALAIDPRSVAAHSAFARVAIDSGLGRAVAAPHVAIALNLDPFDARAHIASFNVALADGDLVAAERTAFEAVALDPTSFSYAVCVMATAFFRRSYADAIAQARELLAIEPRSRVVRIYLADALSASGRPAETLELVQPGGRLSDDPYELASGAWARACVGDRSGAQRTLERMLKISRTRQVSGYLLAYGRLASGDAEAAMGDLEAAVASDPGWLTMIENDPVFTELYDVRRFRNLIAQRPNEQCTGELA